MNGAGAPLLPPGGVGGSCGASHLECPAPTLERPALLDLHRRLPVQPLPAAVTSLQKTAVVCPGAPATVLAAPLPQVGAVLQQLPVVRRMALWGGGAGLLQTLLRGRGCP